MRAGRGVRFRDAIARGQPAEKVISRRREANADLTARGSIVRGLLHDGSERSRTQKMALLHNRYGAANFLEIGQHVRTDKNSFPLAIQIPKQLFQLSASFGSNPEAGSSSTSTGGSLMRSAAIT